MTLTRFLCVGGLLTLLAFSPVPVKAADATQLTEKGIRLYEKGEYSKALRVFLKVKKSDPNSPVAREYINRCTGKMVEAQKEIRLREAIQKGESSSATILPKDPVPAWTVPSSRPTSRGVKSKKSKKNDRKGTAVLPYSVYEQNRTAPSFFTSRDHLADGYRNKILEGPAIELVRKGKNVEVVAFMNRLFLPFSDSLAPDAIPDIQKVSWELHSNPGKTTLFRAVDSLTPAVRHQMLDLPARRVSILFSVLLQASVGVSSQERRETLTAADLDD
jgi:hypothetical protein